MKQALERWQSFDKTKKFNSEEQLEALAIILPWHQTAIEIRNPIISPLIIA